MMTRVGEYFQTIVDLEVGEDAADGLAASVVAWLAETGVVAARASRCLLGDEEGHAPGPRYASAVTEPWPDLLTLRNNGLEVVTGRTVFYSMGTDSVTCPACGEATPLDGDGPAREAWDRLAAAIGEWDEGGSGGHPCPHCHHVNGLNDWAWSPPWGFANLGLTFWNWPTLDGAFVAEVSARLGHRTVVPFGKL